MTPYPFFGTPRSLLFINPSNSIRDSGDQYVDERTHPVRGLIIDKENSSKKMWLATTPLITCSAYVFSYETRDGVHKAILYHATASGPILAPWIAKQIEHETDLSKVSIIIATPGTASQEKSITLDTADIGIKHSASLEEAGFTSSIQLFYGCSSYYINSQGQHGNHELGSAKITGELRFKALLAPARTAAEAPMQRHRCLIL